jgi:dTDP-4-dehydrorhamnose reductase
MKILITGAAGQLGTELQRCTWPVDYDLVTQDRAGLDITDGDAVARAVDDVDCVINAAAYTNVDDAESNKDLAFQINTEAPGLLATACAAGNIPLVHVSTDYVFDRDEHRPIAESATPNPVNVYAQSKLAGEDAVRAATRKYLVLRVGWLYAAHGRNFLRTMLKLGAERDELRVVDDQYGIPTAAHNVAVAIVAVVANWQREPTPNYGTFHFADLGSATWFEFAQEIFSVAEEYGYIAPQLVPIDTSAYPTPAKRPRYSILDARRFERFFGTSRRDWRLGTRDIVCKCLGCGDNLTN